VEICSLSLSLFFGFFGGAFGLERATAKRWGCRYITSSVKPPNNAVLFLPPPRFLFSADLQKPREDLACSGDRLVPPLSLPSRVALAPISKRDPGNDAEKRSFSPPPLNRVSLSHCPSRGWSTLFSPLSVVFFGLCPRLIPESRWLFVRALGIILFLGHFAQFFFDSFRSTMGLPNRIKASPSLSRPSGC